MKKFLRVTIKPFVLICLILIFVGLATVFSQKQFAASLIFGDPPRKIQATGLTEESKQPANKIVEPAKDSPSAQASFKKDENFDALISKALENGKMRVIIGFEMPFVAEGELSEGFAKLQRSNIRSAQENLLDRLSQFAISNVKQFEFIPFMAIETDAAALKSLKNDPEVTFIQEDAEYEALLAESTPVVGANASWTAGFAGSGYTVAILDTGVDKSHPFLNGTKVVSEACYSTTSATLYNSVCPGGVTSSTASGSGVNCSTSISGCDHGTHVAGIAAGNNTFTNIDGVARDSSIIAIQVFSKDLWANKTTAITSDIIKGLERVYALRSTYNIAAVNLSLGGGAYTSNCDSTEVAFKSAIDNLRSANIATVAAAGNDGLTNALAFPACISTAVSVGSTRDGSSSNGVADTVSTTFSNSASFLSILAPGELINSSVPGTGYDVKQGTSMAAPHVAGAWAIMKQRMGSGATVQQVLDRLNNTGVSVTDSRNNITKKRIKIDTAVYVGCNPILSSNNSRISSSGGSGSFSLTIVSNCGWNAVSNVPWLTTSSTATGSGTITYSVAANNSTSERTGVISVAGQEFRVTQNGASCSFSFSPANQSISATGGMGSTYIFAPTGCSWSTVNDSSSWLTITSGGSGNGNGLLTYSAAANLSVLQREARITLAGGQTFTVMQPANAGNQACTTSPGNLAAWYRGEGNVNDSQGVNNGAAQNGAAFAAGQVGQAISLDGVDDYVSVSDSDSLDITGAMTIEGWVYPTASTSRIVSKQSVAGGSTSYILGLASGRLAFYSTDAGTNQISTFNSTREVPLNQWSHVAVTISSSGFSFYVNGIAEGVAVNLTNRPATDGPLFIGVTRNGAGSGQGFLYFGGKIDELSLYNRALTATELLSVYNAGGAGKCAPQCTYSINPTSAGNPTNPGVAASGGIISTNVTASAGCAWTVSNSNSWITVTSGASGTGIGTVQLSVGANNSPNSRTGTVTIAGQAFTVTQAGQNCTYSVPTSSVVGPEAGSFSVNVTAPTGCAWTSENTNNLDYLIFTTGSGTGSGTAYLYVGPNTSSKPRSGVVTIAGQAHTVIQLGVSCNYSISSPAYSIGSGGGNWFFNIASPDGCLWSAASNVPWITFIVTPSSGSGDGTINYLAAINRGGQRTGVINIAGLTHTVTQSAASYSNSTGTGQNVTVTPTSDLNLTFSNVTASGTTNVTALSQNQLPSLPANFSLIDPPLMYDITTTAVYSHSSNITVSFKVPNIADATTCSRLRSLHYENGAWTTDTNAAPQYNSATKVCTVSQIVTSLSPFVVAQLSADLPSTAGLQYYPLAYPIRLLDTRSGQPACYAPGEGFTGYQAIKTQPATVTCQGLTIPSNAAAIVGTATALNTPGPGNLRLYPAGEQLAEVSNVNFIPGRTVSNSFTVKLGTNGAFNIYSYSPSDVVIDVTGYYAPPETGGLYYHQLPNPIRILETRPGEAGYQTPGAPLSANSVRLQQAGNISYLGVTIPAAAKAITGNATVVNNGFASAGSVRLYPGDIAQVPITENINYVANQTIPNAFTARLDASGRFNIYTSATTHVIIDVTGYYSTEPVTDQNGSQGLLFNILPRPFRLLDTRAGETACDAPGAKLSAQTVRVQTVRGRTCSNQTVPSTAKAIFGNATVVNNFAGASFGNIRLYPGEQPLANASNLNYVQGDVMPNSFIVGLGASNGAMNIWSYSATDFIVDVSGYFAAPPTP